MSSRTKRKKQRRLEHASEAHKEAATRFCKQNPVVVMVAVGEDMKPYVPDPATITRADVRELARLRKFGGYPTIGLQRRLVPQEQASG